LTITLGSRPSMIATTLFVVPRSMPMILPMVRLPPKVVSRALAYEPRATLPGVDHSGSTVMRRPA